MQVTTLNRVISLFIIGVVVMVVLALLQWSAIHGWLMEHYLPANWVPLIGVVATLALGAVAVVLGVAVDAIVDSFVRNLIIEQLIRRESFPWAPRPLRGMLFWRHRMRQALGDDIPREEEFSFGAAFFFRTTDAKHNEWLIQHYSMYQLECDAALVGLGTAVWLIADHPRWMVVLAVLSLVMLYHSIERVAYVYQLVFRNACLVLEKRLSVADAVVR